MDKKELNFILQEGEGQYIEFKEKLSGLDKEIVAFANSSGGKIFLGVDEIQLSLIWVQLKSKTKEWRERFKYNLT
ncbi:ATP-binding protein [Candidatus Woesearchaeota archaeon]|nr:ATP-binding protein [Candidatus Woesearchaeota archaeon]